MQSVLDSSTMAHWKLALRNRADISTHARTADDMLARADYTSENADADIMLFGYRCEEEASPGSHLHSRCVRKLTVHFIVMHQQNHPKFFVWV